MKRRKQRAAVFVGSALALVLASAAHSGEKSVAEEILDILRDGGQISEAQYTELRDRARAETAATPAVSAGDSWDVYWKDGVRVESSDKKHKIKIGGRLMHDWAYFDADSDVASFLGDPDLDGGSGSEFRRARLFVSGTLWERVKFKAQYDFGGNDADLKDAYVEMTKIPTLGNVRMGHFKEPVGLETLTSSKYLTFMERSLPSEAFWPERNAGVMVHNHALDKKLSWAVGAFRETDSVGADFGDDEVWGVTGRIAGVPWYEEDGRRLLHLGLSYSHRFSDGAVRYRSRPEAHLSPVRYVDTTALMADDVDLINPELALVLGPFSFQGEYYRAMVDRDSGSDPDFDGFYAEASYFITGESRSYKLGSQAFGRVKPKKNFDLDGGYGAWQVALRYSSLDLDDGSVEGGEIDNWTVGVNWHWNPNVRMMFNWVRADLDRSSGASSVDDTTDVFQTRLQIDF